MRRYFAQAYLRIEYEFDPQDRSRLAASFQNVGEISAKTLGLPVEVTADVEAGSIKIRVTLKDVAFVALLGMSHMNTIVQFVENSLRLAEKSRDFSAEVFSIIGSQGLDDNVIRRKERRIGANGKLLKIVTEIDYIESNIEDISINEMKARLQNIRLHMNELRTSLPVYNLAVVDEYVSQIEKETTDGNVPRLPKDDGLRSGLPAILNRRYQTSLQAPDQLSLATYVQYLQGSDDTRPPYGLEVTEIPKVLNFQGVPLKRS